MNASFELRFCSLFQHGRGYAFPCDADGRVQLDSMSERARHSYQRAQSLVGAELATPVLQLRSDPAEGTPFL